MLHGVFRLITLGCDLEDSVQVDRETPTTRNHVDPKTNYALIGNKVVGQHKATEQLECKVFGSRSPIFGLFLVYLAFYFVTL